MVKLLMTWDIQPGKETTWLEFILKEFAPTLMKMGIQPTDLWFTVVGTAPQVLSGGVTEDLQTMNQILEGKEWQVLHEKLLSYVIHFQKRVVAHKGRFQM